MKKFSPALIVVLVMILSAGCNSNDNTKAATSQVATEKQGLSLDEVKTFILKSEDLLQEMKAAGSDVPIGSFGVSPLYGLAEPDRGKVSEKLSKYFAKDLYPYVLATHEIFCSEKLCGLYGDSEGQYVVQPDGIFSIQSQNDKEVKIQVPFLFEGLPSDYQDLGPSYGTYTISKRPSGPLITLITQEYNDKLYNYGQLQVESLEETYEENTVHLSDSASLYSNERYGYAIRYPSQWSSIEESISEDGAILYQEEGNDIRVYGGYLLGDPMDNMEIDEAEANGWSIETIKIAAGDGRLIQSAADNQRLFHFIVNDGSVQCHLYAKVTEEYFNANYETLLAMAKSIEFYS